MAINSITLLFRIDIRLQNVSTTGKMPAKYHMADDPTTSLYAPP